MPRKSNIGDEVGKTGPRGGKRKKAQMDMVPGMAMPNNSFVPLFAQGATPSDVAKALGIGLDDVPVPHDSSAHEIEALRIFTARVSKRLLDIISPTLADVIMGYNPHMVPMQQQAPPQKKPSKKKRASQPLYPDAPDHVAYGANTLQRPMDPNMMHHQHHQHQQHHMDMGLTEEEKKARAKFPHEYGELLRAEINKNPQTKPKDLQTWLKTYLLEKHGGRLPADFPDDKKIATKIANLKTSLRKRTEPGAR
mmetsp:Transcript_558/g.1420  ORF Transcript_558/g.1420 Transcript_558/m.1420 type:complete len:251 (+) Transcript_558:127-879(+)